MTLDNVIAIIFMVIGLALLGGALYKPVRTLSLTIKKLIDNRIESDREVKRILAKVNSPAKQAKKTDGACMCPLCQKMTLDDCDATILYQNQLYDALAVRLLRAMDKGKPNFISDKLNEVVLRGM